MVSSQSQELAVVETWRVSLLFRLFDGGSRGGTGIGSDAGTGSAALVFADDEVLDIGENDVLVLLRKGWVFEVVGTEDVVAAKLIDDASNFQRRNTNFGAEFCCWPSTIFTVLS